MSLLRRIACAARMARRDHPRPGRVVMPRKEDSVRDYPSAGLTPSRLMAILREADDGSLATAMQLFEEMEEKDPHLFAVANTRRLALTGLPWEVVSLADLRSGVDRTAADETADYARTVLESIENFAESLQHLALAVGRNIALAEIIWEAGSGGLQPVELVPVDFTRLVFDGLDRVRILTADAPRDGTAPPPHKFIVHTPHSVSGHPQRGGVLRVTAMAYLAKNLSFKDWMVFSEVFGMPVRVARYEPRATAEEKRELLHMLESLGSNAAGIFSKAIELDIIEPTRSVIGPPYQNLVEYLNREISKAWLGQTLTTDISGHQGALAATQVHELVRGDILQDDIAKETRTIRRDLLTPMVRMRFGEHAPVPIFRRRLEPPRDLRELAEILAIARERLGIEPPRAWVHEALGIPEAETPTT